MNDASRTQGWSICFGAGALALLFLLGILNGSYWAIALPVAALVFFVLGLAGWVGFTIATIQVDAEPGPEVLATDAEPPSVGASATTSTPSTGPSATSSDPQAAAASSEDPA